MGFSLKLRHRSCPDQGTPFHVKMRLRTGELVTFANLAYLQSSANPEHSGGAQGVHIEPNIVTHTTGLSATIAQTERDRIFSMAGHQPDRRFQHFSTIVK